MLKPASVTVGFGTQTEIVSTNRVALRCRHLWRQASSRQRLGGDLHRLHSPSLRSERQRRASQRLGSKPIGWCCPNSRPGQQGLRPAHLLRLDAWKRVEQKIGSQRCVFLRYGRVSQHPSSMSSLSREVGLSLSTLRLKERFKESLAYVVGSSLTLIQPVSCLSNDLKAEIASVNGSAWVRIFEGSTRPARVISMSFGMYLR
jgi:hypothetical protein